MARPYGSNAFYAADHALPNRAGKGRSLASYRQSGDAAQANAASGFPLYTEPEAISERLRYLQERRLNAFR